MAQPNPRDKISIDLRRYRRVRRFFTKAILHGIWWDVVLNRPLLRGFRTPATPRWQAIAGEYRALAAEMGGVLIKLGQFLSIRVDILPREVTRELAGLQDEVPAVLAQSIIDQVEADFGRPIGRIFKRFDPKPLGSASLAQVHRVQLLSGDNAVVKVLRPGIDVLVETDLAAIGKALDWLRLYSKVRERVDMDWLAREFTEVTRKELDFLQEGKSIERFAEDFKDDPQVALPKVHWNCCGRRTLTLADMSFIKIADLSAIDAAGIDRAEVAKTLHRIYMRQVFETYFVHVDPHPGNLFLRPLPTSEEKEAGVKEFLPGEPVPFFPGRGFQLVLIDFGMAVEIPERLRTALREYAIGVGTRDAHRIVQSMVKAGALLKSADLRRLEEAHEAIFERLWGIRVGSFKDMAFDEMRHFSSEYRDVILDAPFQFQADMLFVVRAVGILSGMAAHLDPDFDPWEMTIPFAERFAKENLRAEWPGLVQEIATLLVLFRNVPDRMDRLLKQVEGGRTAIQTGFTPDAKRSIDQLEGAVRRLSWMVLTAGLLIGGAYLHGNKGGGFFGWLLIFLALLSFVRAILT